MYIELVNVVAGGDLGVEVDLHALLSSTSQYSPKYEPEISPGLYFELPDTGVTVMIFGSGKYHLTGGESIEQIHEANKELISVIENNSNIKIKESRMELRNLVYRGEFNREFDLAEVADDLPEPAGCYSEEQLGLKYRSETFSGLLTVHRTGRFTITGVKKKKEARGLISEFQSLISALMSN